MTRASRAASLATDDRWIDLARRCARLAVEVTDLEVEIHRLRALLAEKRLALRSAARQAVALHDAAEPSHDDLAREAISLFQAEEFAAWRASCGR